MADQPNILRPEGTLDAKGKPLPIPGQPESHNFPGEYIPSPKPGCPEEDRGGWGRATSSYPYIWYGNLSEADFDAANEFNPCRPWYHSTATIDSLQISGALSPGIFSTGADINMGTGHIFAAQMNATTFNGVATSAKSLNNSFDIPHVKNPKKRIRHVIAEGPEAGIYVRGRLSGENVIKLPEYWDGLIDPSTITVTLTQIRTSQDLMVDAIEWGKVIKIKSGNASAIDCFYEVWAARWLNPMDHSEKLHVVYEGDSPADYPGNNEMFLVGGWDYDRRETKWRRPEEEVDSVDLDADA